MCLSLINLMRDIPEDDFTEIIPLQYRMPTEKEYFYKVVTKGYSIYQGLIMTNCFWHIGKLYTRQTFQIGSQHIHLGRPLRYSSGFHCYVDLFSAATEKNDWNFLTTTIVKVKVKDILVIGEENTLFAPKPVIVADKMQIVGEVSQQEIDNVTYQVNPLLRDSNEVKST